MRSCLILVGLLGVLLMQSPVRGDAVIRTQAMRASTIAEFYVDDGRLLLELEIGFGDLPVFANLLPDEIHVQLGQGSTPLEERLGRFFSEDLVVEADGQGPLPGRLVNLKPRDRVVRDEVTGQPLPVSPEDVEKVLFVRLEILLPGRPRAITIAGEVAGAAGIGFVLYHQGVAVNDFRYFSRSQTVRLDWEDPWYSAFERRALRRTHYAPMSGFLYVEPYEVRKEVIVRPKDLQRWIDLGLDGRQTIPVAARADLERAAAAFLRDRQPVVIDGEKIEPELARIHFLERTLRSSQVVDPRVELALDSAVLGAIFVYRTAGLPQRVTMEWDLFDAKIQEVPTAAVDQAGPLGGLLSPGDPILEWQNFLTQPRLPTLVTLTSPPGSAALWGAWLRWPALVLALFLGASLWRGRRHVSEVGGVGAADHRRLTPGSLLLALVLLVAGTGFWLDTQTRLSDERVESVVSGLLHNVYRAFDHRDEEEIYDVLAKSVAGDLLTRIYLETRQGLELANQGGARAKVKAVDIIDLVAETHPEGGFLATLSWHVTGSVGHWGHVHQRRNAYGARLDVRSVDGVWKVTALEILEEERLPLSG